MKRVSIIAGLALLNGLPSATAQSNASLELHQRILFVIAQTVGRICYTVDQEGKNTGVGLSLGAGSELKDGLTRVADLDFKGSAEYRSEQYQGVLRAELGATIEKTQNCKQDVFNKLIERMMPLSAELAPEAVSLGGTSTIVRDFYRALARGDGLKASSLVVPEKRASGPFSAQELTAFYSSLSEPLRLLGLATMGNNRYQATYTYRARQHVCAGSAIVMVAQRNGRAYIEKINVLQGC